MLKSIKNDIFFIEILARVKNDTYICETKQLEQAATAQCGKINMKTTSHQQDLSSEKAANILENLGYNLEKDITINSVSKKKTGYGHYELSVEIGFDKYDSVTIKRTTTDMQLTDNWNEELYSDEDPELGSSQQVAFAFVMGLTENQNDLENIIND
jgi:hypothetical protein